MKRVAVVAKGKVMNIAYRLPVIVLTLSVLGLPADLAAFAQSPTPRFEVYPFPSGVTPSPQFTVTISQSGPPQASFVYQTLNPAYASPPMTSSSTLERSTSWTSFSTNAPVTVQVTNNVPFTGARILPSRYEIYPTISGNTVSFTMSDQPAAALRRILLLRHPVQRRQPDRLRYRQSDAGLRQSLSAQFSPGASAGEIRRRGGDREARRAPGSARRRTEPGVFRPRRSRSRSQTLHSGNRSGRLSRGRRLHQGDVRDCQRSDWRQDRG